MGSRSPVRDGRLTRPVLPLPFQIPSNPDPDRRVVVRSSVALSVAIDRPSRTSQRPLTGCLRQKSRRPFCGCCGAYAGLAREEGYGVMVVEIEDLSSLKRQMASRKRWRDAARCCLDCYVVEGHVPFRVVDRRLKEAAGPRGIALPGMPTGSPGMTGRKPFLSSSISRVRRVLPSMRSSSSLPVSAVGPEEPKSP